MFGYHKNIEELKKGNIVPSQILVEKSESTDNKFLALFIDNEKIASVIEQSELDKLIELTKKNELATTNSPIKGNELSGITFEYKYWNDKLFELKVNDYTIIMYKKESKTLAFVILIMGIIWTSFQVWVIIKLVTKGTTIYDNSFKNE
tara:strand:- start:131 stop:574 length:444 start_codon:yes stop_codon:yes gene_type:complete